jgi:hypothetical protein
VLFLPILPGGDLGREQQPRPECSQWPSPLAFGAARLLDRAWVTNGRRRSRRMSVRAAVAYRSGTRSSRGSPETSSGRTRASDNAEPLGTSTTSSVGNFCQRGASLDPWAR